MKFFRIKTDKGIYYDAVGTNGSLGTNKNSRKWCEVTKKDYVYHPESKEIDFNSLPKQLREDFENYNLQ